MTSTDHQGDDDFPCCSNGEHATPPADDVREALFAALWNAFNPGFALPEPDHPDRAYYFAMTDDLLADRRIEVRPRGTLTPPANDVRYVNADVVLAALAQMKDVAADRQLFHGTKVSILRRRTVSLQQQIENQARPTPPADDVRNLLVDARQLVDSWDHRGSWSADSPVGMVMRLADALEAAREVRPRGTLTDAEVDRVQEAAGERGVFMQDWEVRVILEEARRA